MSKSKHTVQQNETLSHVAKQHYGKVDYWKGLVKAYTDNINEQINVSGADHVTFDL